MAISQENQFLIRLSGSAWKDNAKGFLKSLFKFPNEFELQPKIPQISRKCLEAKFRVRFRQVQQVNIKDKNYGSSPGYLLSYTKSFKQFPH